MIDLTWNDSEMKIVEVLCVLGTVLIPDNTCNTVISNTSHYENKDTKNLSLYSNVIYYIKI